MLSDCSGLETISDYEPLLHSLCDEVSKSNDSGDENASEFELQIKLWDCAIENNITFAAKIKLICILKPYHPQLPKCSKTLLNSKPATIRIVTNSEFLYLGVELFL